MEFPKSHGFVQLLLIYNIQILDRQINCMFNLGKVIFRATAPHTAPHRRQSRLHSRFAVRCSTLYPVLLYIHDVQSSDWSPIISYQSVYNRKVSSMLYCQPFLVVWWSSEVGWWCWNVHPSHIPHPTDGCWSTKLCCGKIPCTTNNWSRWLPAEIQQILSILFSSLIISWSAVCIVAVITIFYWCHHHHLFSKCPFLLR